VDSLAIESTPPTSAGAGADEGSAVPSAVVTDGGRYEVDVAGRQRTPVYWSSPHNVVRRSLWYVGIAEAMFPLSEAHCTLVEEKFQASWKAGKWRVEINLDDGVLLAVYTPPPLLFLCFDMCGMCRGSCSVGDGAGSHVLLLALLLSLKPACA
jgi:hypothetical protein